MLCTAFSLYTE